MTITGALHQQSCASKVLPACLAVLGTVYVTSENSVAAGYSWECISYLRQISIRSRTTIGSSQTHVGGNPPEPPQPTFGASSTDFYPPKRGFFSAEPLTSSRIPTALRAISQTRAALYLILRELIPDRKSESSAPVSRIFYFHRGLENKINVRKQRGGGGSYSWLACHRCQTIDHASSGGVSIVPIRTISLDGQPLFPMLPNLAQKCFFYPIYLNPCVFRPSE